MGACVWLLARLFVWYYLFLCSHSFLDHINKCVWTELVHESMLIWVSRAASPLQPDLYSPHCGFHMFKDHAILGKQEQWKMVIHGQEIIFKMFRCVTVALLIKQGSYNIKVMCLREHTSTHTDVKRHCKLPVVTDLKHWTDWPPQSFCLQRHEGIEGIDCQASLKSFLHTLINLKDSLNELI